MSFGYWIDGSTPPKKEGRYLVVIYKYRNEEARQQYGHEKIIETMHYNKSMISGHIIEGWLDDDCNQVQKWMPLPAIPYTDEELDQLDYEQESHK